MNGKKQSKEQNEASNYILTEIPKLKKIHNLENFNDAMKKIKDNAEIIPLATLQKFAILLYSFYNDLSFKEKNKDTQRLIKLADYMINNLNKKEFLNLIQSEINAKFSKEDFKDYKIFEDRYSEKNPLEICFAIIILSKNINLMKIFFTEYLKVNVFSEDKFNSINLENPFAAKLFDSLFYKLYEQIKIKQINNLNSIIKDYLDNANKSLFNMFRCSKCYDIMMIKLNIDNNFEMICPNCDKDYKVYTLIEIKETLILNINCAMCHNKLILYEENYKCIKCKSLLCSKCESKHLEKCLCLNYIKLYEVGYKCETHCCIYTLYCFKCKKNLCKICKEIHPHKVKEIESINDKIKTYMKNLDENNKDLEELGLVEFTKNDDIKKYLYLIYISRNKIKLFNGNMLSILCELLNLDLQKYNKEILFNKFNDKEFKDYYSVLLNKIDDGNFYYLEFLDSIKSLYRKKNIIDFKYNISNFTKREKLIQLLIERCKSQWKDFNNLHKFINYDISINKLKTSDNDIKLKINELNSRVLLLENSNKVLQENTHNILCRFLADALLQIIIVKYYNYLNPISLNLNILLDFVSNSNYDILSNDNIINLISNISEELSDKLNKFKNDSKNKELKEEIIKLINSSCDIKFSKDLIINGETLKKEELNKILDILFFIKNFGNITAHPNINIDDSLKMISIQSLPVNFEIEYFYNNNLKDKIENKINDKNKNNTLREIKLLIDEDDNNYYLDEFNSEIKSEYNISKNLEDYMKGSQSDIENKIKKIRDDLLQNFNICKIKKEVKIEDIFDTIFTDKDQVIFQELKDFLILFLRDTDNIIKKNLAKDLEEEFVEQNENINNLIQALEEIHSIIQDFIELRIPRHRNLERYIKDIKNNQDTNYNIYIKFIKDFEKKILKEKNFQADCEESEIILEVCALLMVKTYEKEKEYLKDIKKKYETEFIKNLVYEDVEHKLNEIYKEFEKKFNTNTKFKLANLIKEKFELKDTERIKNILKKIINKVPLNESKNSKLNIKSKLFYCQNK